MSPAAEAQKLPDDAWALQRCRDHDAVGLEVLVTRYQLSAARTAYLLVHDRSSAEDIVQESFLRVYLKCGQIRQDAAFVPWFYGIVLNTAREHQRRLLRRRELAFEQVPQAEVAACQAPARSDPHVQAESHEDRATMLVALAQLTAKQREVLVLRYYCEFTDREIAGILRCPAGTVRWRLHTALRALRRILVRDYIWLAADHVASSPATTTTAGGTTS